MTDLLRRFWTRLNRPFPNAKAEAERQVLLLEIAARGREIYEQQTEIARLRKVIKGVQDDLKGEIIP